jgi:4-carboxymuconolactone decarboxylase
MQSVTGGRTVAPALEKYAKGPLADFWKRAQLIPRDRSIVTFAALIARNQTIEMPHHFGLALENGVTPAEISEIIAHLAFYSGWANAMSAVAVAENVFAERKIGVDQLPAASPAPLQLDNDAEAKRAANVEQLFGKVAPGLVQNTTDVLFRDLWLRPDLAPRDRSLVTVSALIASGQVAQIKVRALRRPLCGAPLRNNHAHRLWSEFVPRAPGRLRGALRARPPSAAALCLFAKPQK